MAASGWPKMPKTPHSSLNLSIGHRHSCSLARTPCHSRHSSASILRCSPCEVTLERRRPDLFSFGRRDSRSRRLAANRDREPRAAGRADHLRRHAGSAASCSSACAIARRTDTTTRDADSPNSVAEASAPRSPGRRHVDRRGRCRRCRTRTRPASRRARRRSSRGPIAAAAAAAAASAARSAPARASRSSAGGIPGTRPCTTFEVLAAAELAVALAEQHDRRRRRCWNVAADRPRSRLRSAPTTPMIGVG